MTDSNTMAPSDDDLRSLWRQHAPVIGGTLSFARAVLAKWGAPAPASQPFAYEFSRSNGDGTHSEHIERGRLQEVAPGRWEHSGLPRGALADKPIKALYTTPQTQPVALPAGFEPVGYLEHGSAGSFLAYSKCDANPQEPVFTATQVQAMLAAVLESGPVGFDHKTAANFLNGKPVADEEMRRFVAHSRWAHDDRDGLRNSIADLRREIAQRDAEIALLKTSLLDVEPPTQAAQAQDPRFCYRSHPHEHQDTHCQLREVSAWLRWHASACTTPSADSMRLYADQVDAVTGSLLDAPAQPVAWAATSEDGDVEALGMNESRRFDTPLYKAPQPPARAQEDALLLAATDARDWFEQQAKAVSKGCGSSYELWDLRAQRDLLDAAIAAQQGGARCER